MEMIAKVYEVEFLKYGKINYFTYEGELSPGTLVLGMSFFGLDVGKIIKGPFEIDINEVDYEIKPLMRPLTEDDMQKHEINIADAAAAYDICMEKILKLSLPMKLLKAQYMFDRSKLLFYFSAEGRVDFRELVKELAHSFRTRIELRQVGVRDELKFIGSIGMCGQPVCCRRFKREFDKITLKDAKKQQMMINPAKISGQCKRLLCCLKYELDTYEEIMQDVPVQGSIVQYNDEICKVISCNIFTKNVSVLTDDGKNYEIAFDYFKERKDSVISQPDSHDDELEELPDEE
ncbi:MAG TPA: regulatory iron-sulfur-containing complex subunit RicT [Thermotogota bacterium]|nr:regulatory iron-sulfur-containing complex subunit RicT [Thermotogota bacterium]HPJ87597.1 regulatory iron-sulfur-containing complex subunit RicT [Thermotogota bacterium]HPR94802.1 regulatory iron-sulfur-containing complex subunit RicT [Thermotogota bacterium]